MTDITSKMSAHSVNISDQFIANRNIPRICNKTINSKEDEQKSNALS